MCHMYHKVWYKSVVHFSDLKKIIAPPLWRTFFAPPLRKGLEKKITSIYTVSYSLSSFKPIRIRHLNQVTLYHTLYHTLIYVPHVPQSVVQKCGTFLRFEKKCLPPTPLKKYFFAPPLRKGLEKKTRWRRP